MTVMQMILAAVAAGVVAAGVGWLFERWVDGLGDGGRLAACAVLTAAVAGTACVWLGQDLARAGVSFWTGFGLGAGALALGGVGVVWSVLRARP